MGQVQAYLSGNGITNPCDGVASGTMFYAEDGVWTPLAPSNAASTLKYDPQAARPVWEADV